MEGRGGEITHTQTHQRELQQQLFFSLREPLQSNRRPLAMILLFFKKGLCQSPSPEANETSLPTEDFFPAPDVQRSGTNVAWLVCPKSLLPLQYTRIYEPPFLPSNLFTKQPLYHLRSNSNFLSPEYLHRVDHIHHVFNRLLSCFRDKVG